VFNFDELILVKKIVAFAIDAGFINTLDIENIEKLTNIERKLLAFKVPESNKGNHK